MAVNYGKTNKGAKRSAPKTPKGVSKGEELKPSQDEAIVIF